MSDGSPSATEQPDSDSIDWRADYYSTLAAEWTSDETGVVHPIGTPLAKVTIGPDARGQPLAFVTPSPEALALSLAFEAAARAGRRHERIIVDDPSTRNQPRCVRDEHAGDLYDYFEACFVAVTFAFQAIEAFANREVETGVKGTREFIRGGKQVTWTSDEIQRHVSTDEKIADLLPRLLEVQSPKGRAPWRGYRQLKRERDAIVHLKARDAYPRAQSDGQSVFHRLFAEGVTEHPRRAAQVITWFYALRERPTWLVRLAARENLD